MGRYERWSIQVLVLCTFLFPSTSVFGQLSMTPTAPNGCGSGWSLYFVPNSIPIAKCEFKSACDAHDLCYGKCETSIHGICEYRRCRAGGDLYGKSQCKTDERLIRVQIAAQERRRACDATFYSGIRTINPGKAVCAAFALVYRDAVKTFGLANFAGADVFEGPPQDQASYEAAIREFFLTGTDEQFQRLVEGAEAGKPVVNMKRPIRFVPGKGLVNTDR
jgi:hypothetical protein